MKNKSFKLTNFILLPLILCAVSCNVRSNNIKRSYLNYVYKLKRGGDLHGLSPTSEEVLDRNLGFTSYISLFSMESYISFQCKGTSYENFYCEASFLLLDKDSNVLVEKDSFRCSYTGGQSGTVIYEDEDTSQLLGTIYVYTPYWCRWQFEYDVDGSGEKTLLTFEFWKHSFNPLPDFLTLEDEEI